MAITTQLNEKANIKQSTAADSLIAGRKIVSLEELQTSTANQTTIIIGTFAVDVATQKSLLVIIDGKILTEGASNDYTLTSISPNNTSNTISLTQSLDAGLNIKLLYLGVVVTNSISLDTLSPAMSDWQDYNILLNTHLFIPPIRGTVAFEQAQWRRVGSDMEIRWDYIQSNASGASSGSGSYTFSIPPGFQADLNKIFVDTTGGDGFAGEADKYNCSIIGYGIFNNSSIREFPVSFYMVTPTLMGALWASSGAFNADLNHGVGLANGGNPWRMTMLVRIPIAGWSSNVIAENSKVFKASAYASNGLNVTATPANLGEYRTYKKNAAALTGTDDAPSLAYSPTAFDGFRIDGSVNFASAGTTGQPNRIEIFIGKGKHPTIEAYFGAARSGAVNLKVEPSTPTVFYGVSFSYDPTSGVMIVDAIEQLSGTTSRFAARSMPTSGTASSDIGNIYFDINVSDNVLPVQFSDPSKPARSVVRVDNAVGGTPGGVGGTGSTNTLVQTFTKITTNKGTAITYATSSVFGDSFTINEDGMYNIFFTCRSTVFSDFYVVKNRVDGGPTDGETMLIYSEVPNGTRALTTSRTVDLVVGDVVRFINADNDTYNGQTTFAIAKVSN